MTWISRRFHLLLLIGITTAAVLLRLHSLDAYAPWFDEALCYFQSQELAPLLNGASLSNNPPLFYLLLYSWGSICRDYVFLRLLSVFFGAAAVPLVYLLGRQLRSPGAGLWAALLLACSPLHVYYSQQIKMYALNCCMVLLAAVVAGRCADRPSTGLLAALSVTGAAMLYLHYYLFLPVLMVGCYIAISQFHEERRIGRAVWFGALVTLLYVPWLLVFFESHLGTTVDYVTTYIPRPGIRSLFYTLKNFAAGFHSFRVVYWPAALMVVAGCLAGLVRLVRDRALHWLLPWLLSVPPIAIVFILSQWYPMYLDRYLLYALPPLLLITAHGYGRSRRWRMMPAVLVLLEIVSLPGVYNSRIPFLHHIPGEHERKPVKEAVAYLRQASAPADLVVHCCR
ncbi:glycosyltransferase family 39 protein, partial [bacterium]|nr:glycosyltransferase family 39 protein [candidate division CSSED10-310 bacterium]